MCGMQSRPAKDEFCPTRFGANCSNDEFDEAIAGILMFSEGNERVFGDTIVCLDGNPWFFEFWMTDGLFATPKSAE